MRLFAADRPLRKKQETEMASKVYDLPCTAKVKAKVNATPPMTKPKAKKYPKSK